MKHRLALVGGGVIVVMTVLAILAPWLAPYSLQSSDLAERLLGPNGAHPFGFDEDGFDLMTLVFYGARVSLLISVTTVLISATLGFLIGGIAGYFGGRLDEVFIFVADIFMAFPSILLVIALAAFQRETTVMSVIFILSVVGWVGYARLIRGQVLAMKQNEFIQSAEVVGVRFLRLLWRHILPNVAAPLLVQVTFGMAGVILVESTLSFLGLGVPIDVPSWGRLLDQGVQYLLVAPHISIFPGCAIMVTIFGFNLLGDGLRDLLDVKQ
jgi:peptide/nickel transport system permease protein